MARVPLLTTEQEVDLAKRLERGLKSQKKLEKMNGTASYKKRAELQGHIEDGRDAGGPPPVADGAGVAAWAGVYQC